MRLNPFLIFFLLLMAVNMGSAVTIDSGVQINTTNATITFENTITFDDVVVRSSEIDFNDSLYWSNFTISTSAPITISLYNWSMGFPNEDYNFSVTSSQTSNPTTFGLNTSIADRQYVLLKDGLVNQDIYSDSTTTVISWSWDTWSDNPNFNALCAVTNLTSPADGSSINVTYPPLLHDITFEWEDIGAPSYRIVVARDINFNIVAEDDYVTTNTKTIALDEDVYYWRVYSYYPDDGWISASSDIFDFSLNTNITVSNETAIQGVIYENTEAGSIEIGGALVSIYNTTWSDSQITGANGYYLFTGLSPGDVYTLQATKQGFVDSSVELVTAANNTTVTKNILMERRSGAGDQYDYHYVKFILTSLLGTRYEGVDVKVYEGSNLVETFSGVTGTDGSISFILNQDQEYRITFIDASQGIDVTKTLYPVDTEYKIILFRTNIIPDDRDQDDILFSAYGQSINLTHGYINVSFNDTSGTTTSVQMWIKDTNLTTLYSFSTTNSSADWSQVVDGGNATYIVEFNLDNTVLSDTLKITRTINFNDVVKFDLGFDEGWKYIFVSCLILVLLFLLATKLNAEIITGVAIVAAWFLTFLGWTTAGLTSAQSITVGLMLMLGTILAFGAIIRKGEES